MNGEDLKRFTKPKKNRKKKSSTFHPSYLRYINEGSIDKMLYIIFSDILNLQDLNYMV